MRNFPFLWVWPALLIMGATMLVVSCGGTTDPSEPEAFIAAQVSDPACLVPTTVDFEDFEVTDQGRRFGVDIIPATYQGFDWAYGSASKIATWGSFTVQDSGALEGNDSNGTSIPGAGGSDNWLKARASSVGKGAKITNQDGFVFESMKLFTEDHSPFIGQVNVTWRTIGNVTSDATLVDLVDNTWVEVTAEDLGAEGRTLKAMWFNGPKKHPNSNKFGLDDFTVETVVTGTPLLSVDLSSTTLEIEGPPVPYTATILNCEQAFPRVRIQGTIEQDGASRAANGTDVLCDLAHVGELPLGTCVFDYTADASNEAGGTGTLVAGPATLRVQLHERDPVTGEILELLDEVEILVTLTEPPPAAECPCFTAEELANNQSAFSICYDWQRDPTYAPGLWISSANFAVTARADHAYNSYSGQNELHCYSQIPGFPNRSGWANPAPGSEAAQLTQEDWDTCHALIASAAAGLYCQVR